MDLNVRLIHARNFLKTTPSGDLDLETSKQMLLELVLKYSTPDQYDILIDIRGATGHLTITDVTKLVQTMIRRYRD
ncbi:MAG: hypothetical protein ACREA2_08725 [Blastocatellia bacterium]